MHPDSTILQRYIPANCTYPDPDKSSGFCLKGWFSSHVARYGAEKIILTLRMPVFPSTMRTAPY